MIPAEAFASSTTAPDPSRTAATRIHEAFSLQAGRTPDAVALKGRQEQTSYRELEAQADRLASLLRSRGVRPSDHVGMLLPRSRDAVVAILAVLKAGGIYVPLDAAMPDERLDTMLGAAGVRLVLTQSALAQRLGRGRELLLLDSLPSPLPVGVARPHADGPETAAVLFTSGSTGRPKGVPVPHAGVLNLVTGQTYCAFGPPQVQLLLSSLAFDFSTLELWGALLTGGTLALYEDTHLSFEALGQVIRAQGVTTLMMTPALFNLLVREQLADLGGLRQVLLGGDVPSRAAIQAFLRAVPGATVTNVYGPTENTVFTTCYAMRDPDALPTPIPIGRAVPGTQAHVLGDHGQPTQDGEVGEVWLGGVGLTPGYLNRPDLGVHRFVVHPLSTAADGRLYRSGDLARRRPDGELEFVGRSDWQVKVRGYRVEPGEIEAVMRDHPAVREAVVVARPALAVGEDKRLVAYYEVAGPDDPAPELRAHLARRLPPYMRPAALFRLDTWPMTSSGKIDRQHLAALEVPAESPPARRVQGAPALRDMTALWEELLGVTVGPDDDFFDLGGTSLQAALLLSRAAQRFGTPLHPAQFFAGPTVRGLSRQLDRPGDGWPGSVVRLREGNGERPLFLIGDPFLYRRLAAHLDTGAPIYALHRPLGPIGEMAAQTARDLRVVQARGPYRLAGFSFHGLVAYDLACHLAEAGEATEYLALIDTATPDMEELRLLTNPGFWARLWAHGRYARRLPLARRWPYLWQRASVSIRVRTHRQERNPYFDTLIELVRPHRVRPYGGTVTLFRAHHEDFALIDPLMGWPRVAARVEVRDVPGLHLDLVRSPEGARRLAELMTADLART